MKTIPLIISHKHKYIYYWIPKVASSTVRKLLANHESIEWIFPEDGQAKFTEISRKKVHKFPGYFKFAFVRNPYSRILSCYIDKIVNMRTSKDNRGVKNGEFLPLKRDHKTRFKDMVFSDFIHFIGSIEDETSNGHFRSIHTFLDLDILDFIGRFENFDNDLEKIKKKIGIKQKQGHLRKTRHDHYRNYYNEDLKKIMRKRYQRDFELFNYGF